MGLGKSRQKFGYLPEAQNDYIFAVVLEELGLIGGTLIMILFAFLIIRGFWLAIHARDRFGSLLIVGVTTQIALQTFLNIAASRRIWGRNPSLQDFIFSRFLEMDSAK